MRPENWGLAKLFKLASSQLSMENVSVKSEDLRKLLRDVAQIKQMLIAEKEERKMEEVELTDWAKEELEEARKRPESEYASLEEVKKRILSKK